MNALQEFFSMGGYGAYIWSAYAITFVVMVANVVFARRDYQTRLQHVRRQLNRTNRAPLNNMSTQQGSDQA